MVDHRVGKEDDDWILPSAWTLYHKEIMPKAVRVTRRARLQRFALNHSKRGASGLAKTGLRLQFGVYKGQDLDKLARFMPDATFHGFDSFHGLPEPFAELPQGHFDLGGVPPTMPSCSNVELHCGLFQDTLPEFLAAHPEPCAFVHCDADLYSSTSYLLQELQKAGRLRKGTVLLFDEYSNYEGFESGEYLAWTELGIPFEYLAFHGPGSGYPTTFGFQSVAVICT